MKKRFISLILKMFICSTSLAAMTATTCLEEQKVKTIEYTAEELEENKEIILEIARLQDEVPVFQNQELLDKIKIILNKDTITQKDLLKIKELTIGYLNNSDLSDLKYLQNLEELTLIEIDLNGEDLKHNLSLTSLAVNKGDIHNTNYIPNGVNDVYLYECRVLDNNFYTPYYLTDITLIKTEFNNFTLKDTSYLKRFEMQGNAFLDLKSLEGCNNLKEIELLACPNVKSPEVLLNLARLENVKIDGYAPIWLTIDVLEQSNTELLMSVDEIKSEINLLDNVADTLIPDKTIPDSEKVEIITLYLLKKLNYDPDVINKVEGSEEKVINYNNDPITKTLENNEGICTSYACFFQALANRVGLDSYQLFSDVHTWNMIKENGEYYCVDATFLDGDYSVLKDGAIVHGIANTPTSYISNGTADLLEFYHFNLDDAYDSISDSHKYKLLPLENVLEELNRGYIGKDNVNIIITYKNKNYIFDMDLFKFKMSFGLIILFCGLGIINFVKECVENKLELKKDE